MGQPAGPIGTLSGGGARGRDLLRAFLGACLDRPDGSRAGALRTALQGVTRPYVSAPRRPFGSASESAGPAR